MTRAVSDSITLNGEPHELPHAMTVTELLATLGVPVGRVAVERNRRIVKRPELATTVVEPGDVIEIVHFVGGG